MKQQELDPVCGMKVDTENCEAVFEYRDEDFYFCSERCLNEFKAKPEPYFKQAHERKQTAEL